MGCVKGGVRAARDETRDDRVTVGEEPAEELGPTAIVATSKDTLTRREAVLGLRDSSRREKRGDADRRAANFATY